MTIQTKVFLFLATPMCLVAHGYYSLCAMICGVRVDFPKWTFNHNPIDY